MFFPHYFGVCIYKWKGARDPIVTRPHAVPFVTTRPQAVPFFTTQPQAFGAIPPGAWTLSPRLPLCGPPLFPKYCRCTKKKTCRKMGKHHNYFVCKRGVCSKKRRVCCCPWWMSCFYKLRCKFKGVFLRRMNVSGNTILCFLRYSLLPRLLTFTDCYTWV